MFDKGKQLGIYFFKLAASLQCLDVTYRGQCGSKIRGVAFQLTWISIGICSSILDVFILL